MDENIKRYHSIPFDELNYCPSVGIMYQRDMTVSVPYDNHYFEHYVKLESTEIALKLNEGRTSLTEKYCDSILDVGVGSGQFIRASNVRVYGFDINPVAVRWLREAGIYCDPYAKMPKVMGLTFWDVLEHIPNPGLLLSKMDKGMFAFISMPIFSDLLNLKRSKHYKPNEHYYYFTAHGMITYMDNLGFSLVEMSDFETRAGREGILTFVFCKKI